LVTNIFISLLHVRLVYPGTVQITFEREIAWLPLSPLRRNCADAGHKGVRQSFMRI
jgi:hypothetical protein